MAKKFRDLLAEKPASWRAAVAARKRELLDAMPLHELRRARQLSQEQLAEELGATQTEILAEKMAALKTVDYLEDRARRGDRERFLAALAKVPDVPPEPGDET